MSGYWLAACIVAIFMVSTIIVGEIVFIVTRGKEELFGTDFDDYLLKNPLRGLWWTVIFIVLSSLVWPVTCTFGMICIINALI